MAESILNGKMILAVDDEPDVLEVLEEEIKDSFPNATVDKRRKVEASFKIGSTTELCQVEERRKPI